MTASTETAGSAAASPGSATAASAAASPSGRLVVMFDRDCGICQATARRLRRWDRHGRLEMLSLQDAATSDRPLVAEIARTYPLLDVLHVLDVRTGRVDAGGDAALAIAAALPGGRLISPLRRVGPVRSVVGAAYRLVARNRHEIGRRLRLEGPACDLPR